MANTVVSKCVWLTVLLTATGIAMAKKPNAVETPKAPEPRQQQATPTEAPSRGQLLYEHHCTECHTSVVHVRKNHKAHTPAAVRGWVAKWANHKQLEWSAEDIEAVSDYLGERYYKFGAKP